MKLLDYMREQAAILRTVDDEQFDSFIDNVEQTIRCELNINRGPMIMPEDFYEVKHWLDGAPVSVLCDIDIDEGGVFYYYLCRIGMC